MDDLEYPPRSHVFRTKATLCIYSCRVPRSEPDMHLTFPNQIKACRYAAYHARRPQSVSR